MIDKLQLRGLSRANDAALLVTRLLTGSFLIHGVWDNVTEAARMAEFAGFLQANGFPMPQLASRFSVYTQLLAGVLLLPGLLTRLAGLIVTATFIVGYFMVHSEQSFREAWPALALIAIGLLLATQGGGRYALDQFWDKR